MHPLFRQSVSEVPPTPRPSKHPGYLLLLEGGNILDRRQSRVLGIAAPEVVRLLRVQVQSKPKDLP